MTVLRIGEGLSLRRVAGVRGTTKIAADFALLAAAVNLARLAVLGVASTASGWAGAAR